MSIQPSPPMFAGADGAATRSGDAIVLAARILTGWLFLSNSWEELMHMQGAVNYLASLQVPNPEFWIWPAMGAELLIGVALILGIATRYVSLFTLAYLVIATTLGHRYWEYPAAQQGNQFAHFSKNLAIMGGTLLLYWTGGGRFSLDHWLRYSNR